jgi:hypothetical protein
MKKLLFLALAGVAASANAVITIGASNVAFTDISTGTSVGTISDDSENSISGTALTTAGWVGNALLAGGVDVRVGNNGAVYWGTSNGDTFTNALDIGYTNSSTFMTMTAVNSSQFGNGGLGPRQMLCPLWDDNFPGTGASCTWSVINGDLFIQWTNEDHFSAQGTGTVTYQMIARKTGSSTLVDFVYQDTLYAAQQYQNDGGSATIGYKNWGVSAFGNDVQYGLGGGTDTNGDPAFGGTNMQPKVGGWISNENPALTHSVSITAAVPEPASMSVLALGALALLRRRKKA